MWCLWNFFPNQNGRMRGVRLQRYDAQWMPKVTVQKQMTYTTKGFQILPYLSKKWILQNMTLIKFWAITVNITLGPAPLQFFQFNAKCKLNKAYNRMLCMSLNRISEMEDWKIISVLWQRIIRKILFSSLSVQIAPEAIYFIFEILILWKKNTIETNNIHWPLNA